MDRCPLCYTEKVNNKCQPCDIHLNDWEWTMLEADTYRKVISHLYDSKDDGRRRERARCRIALKNISGMAKENLT
jgi:hypothetical protein